MAWRWRAHPAVLGDVLGVGLEYPAQLLEQRLGLRANLEQVPQRVQLQVVHVVLAVAQQRQEILSRAGRVALLHIGLRGGGRRERLGPASPRGAQDVPS